MTWETFYQNLQRTFFQQKDIAFRPNGQNFILGDFLYNWWVSALDNQALSKLYEQELWQTWQVLIKERRIGDDYNLNSTKSTNDPFTVDSVPVLNKILKLLNSDTFFKSLGVQLNLDAHRAGNVLPSNKNHQKTVFKIILTTETTKTTWEINYFVHKNTLARKNILPRILRAWTSFITIATPDKVTFPKLPFVQEKTLSALQQWATDTFKDNSPLQEFLQKYKLLPHIKLLSNEIKDNKWFAEWMCDTYQKPDEDFGFVTVKITMEAND